MYQSNCLIRKENCGNSSESSGRVRDPADCPRAAECLQILATMAVASFSRYFLRDEGRPQQPVRTGWLVSVVLG